MDENEAKTGTELCLMASRPVFGSLSYANREAILLDQFRQMTEHEQDEYLKTLISEHDGIRELSTSADYVFISAPLKSDAINANSAERYRRTINDNFDEIEASVHYMTAKGNAGSLISHPAGNEAVLEIIARIVSKIWSGPITATNLPYGILLGFSLVRDDYVSCPISMTRIESLFWGLHAMVINGRGPFAGGSKEGMTDFNDTKITRMSELHIEINGQRKRVLHISDSRFKIDDPYTKLDGTPITMLPGDRHY
jgi:hypothetical protein